MAFRQFLQNLFERVGLAEAPMPAPRAADLALGEPEQLRPILLRLAAWGVKGVRLIADESVEPADLLRAVRLAAESGFTVTVRGRASDLAAGKLLRELAAAGAGEVELPILSAVAEVHDALAGMGDSRSVLTALDALAGLKLRTAAQLVLVPSTVKSIERTLQMLDDRRVQEARAWAIVCRDDAPASWALSAGELVKVAARLETSAPKSITITWYPPRKFDPAETLAQQVRRGPRAARGSVRIQPDGSLLPPAGPATAGGNISQNDWKLIGRSEVFRAGKRRQDAAARCEQCPGLAACAGGCLRDDESWAEE